MLTRPLAVTALGLAILWIGFSLAGLAFARPGFFQRAGILGFGLALLLIARAVFDRQPPAQGRLAALVGASTIQTGYGDLILDYFKRLFSDT